MRVEPNRSFGIPTAGAIKVHFAVAIEDDLITAQCRDTFQQDEVRSVAEFRKVVLCDGCRVASMRNDRSANRKESADPIPEKEDDQ